MCGRSVRQQWAPRILSLWSECQAHGHTHARAHTQKTEAPGVPEGSPEGTLCIRTEVQIMAVQAAAVEAGPGGKEVLHGDGTTACGGRPACQLVPGAQL